MSLEKVKLSKRTKSTAFYLFISVIIEVLILTVRLIISAITGIYNWTPEDFVSSPAGMFIQILDLISIINIIILIILIVMFIFQFIKDVFKKPQVEIV